MMKCVSNDVLYCVIVELPDGFTINVQIDKSEFNRLINCLDSFPDCETDYNEEYHNGIQEEFSTTYYKYNGKRFAFVSNISTYRDGF